MDKTVVVVALVIFAVLPRVVYSCVAVVVLLLAVARTIVMVVALVVYGSLVRDAVY